MSINTMPTSVLFNQPAVVRFSTGAPAAEPVTLEEVKLMLRQDGSSDDAMITELAKAARAMVEGFCGGVAFINRTITATYDVLPSVSSTMPDNFGTIAGTGFGDTNSVPTIELPSGPWSAATLKTISSAGTETTASVSSYFLDVEAGRLCLVDGSSWPTGFRDLKGIKVEGTIGYGANAAAVPDAVKAAIKMVACRLYESKGACSDDEAFSSVVKSMLAPYRKVAGFGVIG